MQRLAKICFFTIALGTFFALSAFTPTSSLVKPVQAAPQISEKQQDLADKTFDYTGYYYPRFIVEKLIKFNLSATCWEKVTGKNGWGPHSMSFVTRDIEAWFKDYLGDAVAVTSIEGNGADVQRSHQGRVEKAINDMKNRYFLTVDATDCDCNATTTEFLRKYVEFIGEYPYNYRFTPKSGVFFAHITVTPKVKDVSASVSKDGREFTASFPANNEAPEWESRVVKIFSSAGKIK